MSKSLKHSSFIDLYSEGYVMADEIDDFIDIWHEQEPETSGPQMPLSAFLGMTPEEYEAWVHDPLILPHIIRARREGLSLDEVTHQHMDNMLLAARATDQTAIKALQTWLERRRKN